ncbi:MAG: hypothetical protein AB8B55_05160 [Mariniblastus sp.]
MTKRTIGFNTWEEAYSYSGRSGFNTREGCHGTRSMTMFRDANEGLCLGPL